MNDWYSPPITHTYALPCYHEALTRLPASLQIYSSAHDDILRALAIAAGRPQPPGPPGSPARSSSSFVDRLVSRFTPGGPDATITAPGGLFLVDDERREHSELTVLRE